MEPPPQQQRQQQTNDDGGRVGNNNNNNNNNFLCSSRQSSATRWTPTTDQIRILKDLYYNNGVRSPTADQIQRISARLRQYGKIEGKNVFYWFQNHKARERQKKRFTNTTATPDQIPMPRSSWRSSDQDPIYNNTKYPNICPGVPSPSSSSCSTPGMFAAGQMGSYGYGSVTMEKSFRDCTISAGCSGGGGSIGHNFWVGGGADPPPYSSTYYPFFDQKKYSTLDQETPGEEEEEEEDQEQQEEAAEIETLPLFPIHRDHNYISGFCNTTTKPPESDSSYYSGWYQYSGDGMGGSRASLELSLNSYTGRSSD